MSSICISFFSEWVCVISWAADKERDWLIFFAEAGQLEEISVLEGFRVQWFDDIQDEVRKAVDWRSEMADEKLLGMKEMKSFIISIWYV